MHGRLTWFLRKAAASSLEIRLVCRVCWLRSHHLVCHAADTASLATWFPFGRLFGVANTFGFGETRCRKNLPLYALTVPEITCPNCDAAFAPADILRNSDCSWPELNWLYFQCPSCDDRCHVEVRDNHMATVRFLGAPGPNWERIQSWGVLNLLTRSDPAFLHCWLDDIHYEFPART